MVIMINYGNLFFPFSFFIIHYSLFIKLSFIISLRLSFIIYHLSFLLGIVKKRQIPKTFHYSLFTILFFVVPLCRIKLSKLTYDLESEH